MKREEIINRTHGILEAVWQECYTKEKRAISLQCTKGEYALQEKIVGPIHESKEFLWDSTWGGRDEHRWFYYEFAVPEEYKNQEIIGRVCTGATDIWNTDNPQILVYQDGAIKATLDMNHQEFIIHTKGKVGSRYELGFYAYSNTESETNFFRLTFYTFHREVYELYYDIKTLADAIVLGEEESYAIYEAMEVLHQAIQRLDLRKPGSTQFYNSVKETRDILKKYYCSLPEEKVTVYGIGHTHIDVAWKWTVKQTRQKVIRSFHTVLELMEEYPEYIFMSSQPQLYEFVKEDAPQIYEKIKERVKEGRWETEGGMWLEADCNLSSGESLVRHILYGHQFMRQEFGVAQQEILWLPDVFGYTAALPQLLCKAGIKYFMTTKIAWNDTNKMPNDVMYWQGLDGSKVLTYFITTSDYQKHPRQKELERFETTYNGRLTPNQVKGTWQRFSNKNLSESVLTCYGFGDGGGGTTREMLEYGKRLSKGLIGVPKVKLARAGEFFHHLEKRLQEKKVPVWNGELYLEYHRGTYTSMAKNKKKNRRSERKNLYTEGLSVLANIYAEHPIPKEALHKMWKLTLLNQFHDIIPGSSIKEVYEQSDLEYREIERLQENITKECLQAFFGDGEIEGSENYAIYNGVGRERGGYLSLPDGTLGWYSGKISGFGMKQITSAMLELPGGTPLMTEIKQDVAEQKSFSFETPYYKVTMTHSGEFESIYDKEFGREVLKAGERGNCIRIYEDRPKEYDAWNIDAYYEEKSWLVEEVVEWSMIEDKGTYATVKVKKQFLDSTITQYICFYKYSRRIDFKTIIDWKEQQLLCKVEFPVDIMTTKATYDIQFGNVERPTHKNTSWQEAMFEVCAHKWADLSECDYGVALLNDCKYGYSIHDSVMCLTLLKSGIFPNPEADQELHEFTYSLLPHEGDFRRGNVIQEALALNCSLEAYKIEEKIDFQELPGVSCNAQHILLETCKAAERGDGYILRLHECYGKRGQAIIEVPIFEGRFWCEANLLEEPESQWKAVSENTITLMVKPYEVKTILLR